MQQNRLRTMEGPAHPESTGKGMRRLSPTSEFYDGKRKYANALGQEFFARTQPDGKPPGFLIDIFQLGEGEPIRRYSASLQLMGKALMIKFMTRTSLGSLPRYRGSGPTGYGAAQLILDEAIPLARQLRATSIYLEAVHIKLFAYYQSLGFKEVKGTNYMRLEVPGGPRSP